MKKVLYTNNSKNTQHLGPHTFFPGTSKFVESCYVPGEVDGESENASDEHLVSLFIKQNQQKKIDGLPSLTDSQLISVAMFYKRETPPKKFAPALESEIASRGDDVASLLFAADVAEMDDEDMYAAQLENADNENKLAVISSEIEKRGGDFSMRVFSQEVSEMDDDQLIEALLEHAESESHLAVLQSELSARG